MIMYHGMIHFAIDHEASAHIGPLPAIAIFIKRALGPLIHWHRLPPSRKARKYWDVHAT